MNATFILGMIYLLYFSYKDIKHKKLDNIKIYAFGELGLIWAYINGLFYITLALMGFIFVVAWFLWDRRVIGGADVKLLVCLMPYLGIPTEFTYVFTKLMLFLVIFAFLGLMYGILGRLASKRHKNIPFIPVITLTFLIYWLI
jgi:Flp pilus assembly protein protease CpaA